MTLQKAVLSIGVVAIWVSGCIGDPGGGGGGGVNFHAGYTFIRSGEVYLSDRSDYTRVVQLTNTGNNHNPSISPDSSRAVFVHRSGDRSELDTIAVNASGVSPTLVYASDSTHTNFKMPVFSRDGTFIVFAYESGASSFLGRVDRDGTNFRRVTSGTRSYSAPSVYSDGLRVLASAGNSSFRYDSLETISLGTGAASSVTNMFPQGVLEIANRAVISPNGRNIAVDFRTSSVTRVFSYDIAVSRFNQLTDYPGAQLTNDSFPSWVGDDLIGFSSDFGNNDSIYEIARTATNGSGTLKLASAVEPSFGP